MSETWISSHALDCFGTDVSGVPPGSQDQKHPPPSSVHLWREKPQTQWPKNVEDAIRIASTPCFHPPPRTLHRLVDGIPPGPTWWHIATFDSWRWCHCGIFSWGNGGIIYDKDRIIIANDGINVNGIREHPSCLTMISQAAQAQTCGEYTEVRTKPRIVRYCQ